MTRRLGGDCLILRGQGAVYDKRDRICAWMESPGLLAHVGVPFAEVGVGWRGTS